jgi:MEDS: MEthanogen/methylotroph, DcmR Sensory domain
VKQNLITCSRNDFLEHINKAEYGAHYLLIHPELRTLRKIYSRYVKKQLEEENEIVLIVSYYETADSVRQILSSPTGNLQNNNSIDVRKYENEGSLIIMDSLKAYFGLDSDDDNHDADDKNDNVRPNKDIIITFLKQLIEKAESSGKNGVSVFADIASFYHYNNSVDKLVEYELSLPRKYHGMKMKGFCVYHKADFEKRLTEEQRQKLLTHHGKGLLLTED